MDAITKNEISGAKIVAVYQKYELLDGWLDSVHTYFVCDRGFAFVMPYPGAPWEKVDVPDDAEPAHHPHVDAICRGAIARVCFDPPDPDDGFILPDSGRIYLADGSSFSVVWVAPHGTGSAGLVYEEATPEDDAGCLTEYWDIPIDPVNEIAISPPTPETSKESLEREAMIRWLKEIGLLPKKQEPE